MLAGSRDHGEARDPEDGERARCADESFPSGDRDALLQTSGDRLLEIDVGRVAFPGIPEAPGKIARAGLRETLPTTAMEWLETLTRRDGPLEELDQLQRRWIHLHG